MSDLKFLLRIAQVRPRDLISPIIAGAITLLAALSLTVLSGWLITRAWEMPPVLDLSVAVTAVRALGISRAVFRYLDRLVAHKLGLRALTTLRATMYDAQAAAGRVGRGEGQALLVADTERVTDYIVRTLVPRGVAVVLTVVAIVGAAVLHPLAAVIMAGGFALTGLLIPYLATRASRNTFLVEAENAFTLQLDSVLHDRVEYAVAGKGDALIEQAAQASADASKAWAQSTRPEATASAIQAWATGICALLITWLAVETYTGNPVWLGMLVMLPLAAFEAHGPLAGAAVHADQAKRSAHRLREVADRAEEATKLSGGPLPHPETGVAVRAEALRTVYGDQAWDFELAPGQRMLVRGPSGCGKTTMLETLAGLLPVADGTAAIAEGARLFAEDAWVFATTVRENLLVANGDASDARMAEALEATGFEFDLDFMLENGADSLSSGQRRRLLLARALVSDAPTLLLDEPTEHLSIDAAEHLLDVLLHEPLPGALPQRTVIAVVHVDGPVGIEVAASPTGPDVVS